MIYIFRRISKYEEQIDTPKVKFANDKGIGNTGFAEENPDVRITSWMELPLHRPYNLSCHDSTMGNKVLLVLYHHQRARGFVYCTGCDMLKSCVFW